MVVIHKAEWKDLKRWITCTLIFLTLGMIIISQIGLFQDKDDDFSSDEGMFILFSMNEDGVFSSGEDVFVLVPVDDGDGSSIFLPPNVSAIAFYDDGRFGMVSDFVSSNNIRSLLLTGNFFDIEENKSYVALPIQGPDIGVWTWKPYYDIDCEWRIVSNAFESQGWYPLPQAAAKGGDVVFQQYVSSFDITDLGWIQERFDLAEEVAEYYDYGIFLLQEEVYKPSCMAAWSGVGEPLWGWDIDWEADFAGVHVMSYKAWYIDTYGYWDQDQWNSYAANNDWEAEEVMAWSDYYYNKLVRAWKAHMNNLGKKAAITLGVILPETNYFYGNEAKNYIINNYDLVSVYPYPKTKNELLNALPELYNKRQLINGKMMWVLTTRWTELDYPPFIPDLAALEFYYASALADVIVCYPFTDQDDWDTDYPELLHSFKTTFNEDQGVVMTSSSHARGINFEGELNTSYGMMKAYAFKKNLQQPPTISSFSSTSTTFEMTIGTISVTIVSTLLTKPLSVTINDFTINETTSLENLLNYDNSWYFDLTLKQLYISLDTLPSVPVLFDPGLVDDDGEFLVDWGDSVDPDGFVSYYVLEMASDSDFTNVLQTWTPTASQQFVAGLGEGDYYFRVIAVSNNGASSGWSNVEDITVEYPVIP